MGANIDASLMHGPNTFSWKSVSADSVTAVLYVVCIQAVALSHCRNVAPVLHPKFCPDHSPPLRTWAPNPSCDMLWLIVKLRGSFGAYHGSTVPTRVCYPNIVQHVGLNRVRCGKAGKRMEKVRQSFMTKTRQVQKPSEYPGSDLFSVCTRW